MNGVCLAGASKRTCLQLFYVGVQKESKRIQCLGNDSSQTGPCRRKLFKLNVWSTVHSLQVIENGRRIEIRVVQVYRQNLQMAHFVANRCHIPIWTACFYLHLLPFSRKQEYIVLTQYLALNGKRYI